MKVSAVRLVSESIVYAFTRPVLWWLSLIGFMGFFGLNLFYSAVVARWPGSEYLYVLFQSAFTWWWYLIITLMILCDVRGESCSLSRAFEQSLMRTWSAWWLIAWQTLLTWATIPLLKTPYTYSENVDLLAFLCISLLLAFQLLLNSFIIPEIGLGNDSIVSVYSRSIDFFRRWWFALIRLLLAFIFLATIIFLLVGFVVSLGRSATECIVVCGWRHPIARDGIVAATTTIVMMLSMIASVLLYQRDKSA